MSKGRPKKAVIPSDAYDRIVDEYVSQGFSLKEIGERYGVTAYEVRGVLYAMGINLRPRGRQKGEK